MKSIGMSAIQTGLLVVLSLVYFSFIASHVPDKYSLQTNFILVPIVFGGAAYFILSVTLPTKLMLISLIPVSHILYFGGDPSKPGLENMLGAVEYVFLSAGIGVACLIRMYVSAARSR